MIAQLLKPRDALHPMSALRIMTPPFDPRRIEFLDEAAISMFKSKTPAERLAMAFASHRMVRLRLAGHFQTLHPEWTREEVDAAVAGRLLSGTV